MRLKHPLRYTEIITRLRSQLISINYGVDVIHYFSHLIRANKFRNTQFVHGAKKLEVLLLFAYHLNWVSG